jgi:cyclopropane fatty-acyl-phospholipid synthase-like methyltransferase
MDAGYYERFYEDEKTRVLSRAQVAHLALGVTELIAWFGGELRAVLDIGAGTGLWRDWFAANRSNVRYVSTDKSEYACARYRHLERGIASWRSRRKFDLVICQGVLPYLDSREVSAAIENIAAMCRGFLYLEAATSRDLREHCDARLTDASMQGRSVAFYRSRLSPHFVAVGCGLFYLRTGPLVFYDLEHLDR